MKICRCAQLLLCHEIPIQGTFPAPVLLRLAAFCDLYAVPLEQVMALVDDLLYSLLLT